MVEAPRRASPEGARHRSPPAWRARQDSACHRPAVRHARSARRCPVGAFTSVIAAAVSVDSGELSQCLPSRTGGPISTVPSWSSSSASVPAVPSQLLPETSCKIQQPAPAQLRPDDADRVSLGVDHRRDQIYEGPRCTVVCGGAPSSPPSATVAHRRFSTPSDPAQTTTGRQRSRPPPRRGWRPVSVLAGSPRRSTRTRAKPAAGSRDSFGASPGFRRGARWPASQPMRVPIAAEAQD